MARTTPPSGRLCGLPGLSKPPFETGVWPKTQSGPMKSTTYHFHFLVLVSICLKSSHRQPAKAPDFAKLEGSASPEAGEKHPCLTPDDSESPNHQTTNPHHPSLRPLEVTMPKAEQPRPAFPELEWRHWLTTLFPNHFTGRFAVHHDDLWDWLWNIQLGDAPEPGAFIAIWPRGAGELIPDTDSWDRTLPACSPSSLSGSAQAAAETGWTVREPIDARGLARLRAEIRAYHYPQTGEGVEKDRPVKFFDDVIDPLRALADHFFPHPAQMTESEAIIQALPEHLHPENIRKAPPELQTGLWLATRPARSKSNTTESAPSSWATARSKRRDAAPHPTPSTPRPIPYPSAASPRS
jgi:hypothetical protein